MKTDKTEGKPDIGPLIYLASPYSHANPAMERVRFRRVAYVASRLIKQGHLIFSPICHTHPIAEYGDLAKGWDFWQGYDRYMIGLCDEFWMLQMDGWEQSKGMKAELEYAKQQQKQVWYVDPETLQKYSHDRVLIRQTL